MNQPKVGDIVYQVIGKEVKSYKVTRIHSPYIVTEFKNSHLKEHEWGLTPQEAKDKMLAFKYERLAMLHKHIDNLSKSIYKIEHIITT